MIHKLDSSELNKMFLNAHDKLEEHLNDFTEIENNIVTKTNIMFHELSYMKYISESSNSSSDLNHYKTNLFVDAINDDFEKYGCSVHPKFIDEPINIFNLKTASSDEYYFRNDAIVSINDIVKDTYQDILKHDTLDKNIFFEEFENDSITITISLPEQSKVLGPTTFNAIEFDSFLNGSYDVESITIENALEETYPVSLVADGTNYINNAGKFRIALSDRYNFQTITFKIHLKYQVDGKYPFGLKHIYLYNGNYKQIKINTDDETEILSYAICKIDVPSGAELNSINQKVLIKTLSSQTEDLCENLGIEFFAYYTDGELSGSLPTSELDENPFPGNFTSFYAKIPLVFVKADETIENKTYVSIGINYTTR